MSEEVEQDFTRASEITVRAYQQMAASYAQRNSLAHLPPFWQEDMQRFVECVQASSAWQSDPMLPVLDVGCGHGRDALLFAQQGLRVQAIDLSPAMLAQAHQLCLNQTDSGLISFQQMDMRH